MTSIGGTSVGVPTLTVHGVLPPGVHPCTLDEIAEAFVGDDPNSRRSELWRSLQRYVAWVRGFGFFTDLYIDGSFTTGKVDPGDIDVVLPLPPPSADAQAVFNANREIVKTWHVPYCKTTFEVHPFTWVPGLPPLNDMIDFFQGMRPEELTWMGLPAGSRKGILRVTL